MGSLTQARGHLWARRYGLGRGWRVVGLRSAAGKQLIGCGQEVGEGGVGPGGVVVVVVVGPSGVGARGVGDASVVEAAEDIEALAVDIEVEDHHDEEVHQAQEQHTLADPLQGPAQHQPGHGRGRGRCSATGIRSLLLPLPIPRATAPPSHLPRHNNDTAISFGVGSFESASFIHEPTVHIDVSPAQEHHRLVALPGSRLATAWGMTD